MLINMFNLILHIKKIFHVLCIFVYIFNGQISRAHKISFQSNTQLPSQLASFINITLFICYSFHKQIYVIHYYPLNQFYPYFLIFIISNNFEFKITGIFERNMSTVFPYISYFIFLNGYYFKRHSKTKILKPNKLRFFSP